MKKRLSLKERFESKIYYGLDGCWYWLGALGYSGGKKDRGRFFVNGINKVAARVSYELYKGKINNDLFVCHSCDNAMCVNPDHLYLGAQFDNMKDRSIRANFKITKETVHNVRKLSNVMSQYKIAEILGISQPMVYNILSGKSRKHI